LIAPDRSGCFHNGTTPVSSATEELTWNRPQSADTKYSNTTALATTLGEGEGVSVKERGGGKGEETACDVMYVRRTPCALNSRIPRHCSEWPCAGKRPGQGSTKHGLLHVIGGSGEERTSSSGKLLGRMSRPREEEGEKWRGADGVERLSDSACTGHSMYTTQHTIESRPRFPSHSLLPLCALSISNHYATDWHIPSIDRDSTLQVLVCAGTLSTLFADGGIHRQSSTV
jgi:hypothetical protein